MASEQPQRIVVTSTKSVGIAVLLTVLLGPLGMLYSTVPGGLIMIAVNVVIFLVGLVTFGIAYFLFFITWPICIIWGALAAKSYNAKLMAETR